MSTFTMNCPYCGDELEAETEWIGTPIKCPVCAKLFSIPVEMRKELGLETDEDQEKSIDSAEGDTETNTEKTVSMPSFYFAGFMAKYSKIVACVIMVFGLYSICHLYHGYTSYVMPLGKELKSEKTFIKVEYKRERALMNMIWSISATFLGSILFSILILSYGDICRKIQSITVEQDE